MWPVYGGQNGPKSIVSVAPKAELWTPLGLFGQSQKKYSRKYAKKVPKDRHMAHAPSPDVCYRGGVDQPKAELRSPAPLRKEERRSVEEETSVAGGRSDDAGLRAGIRQHGFCGYLL